MIKSHLRSMNGKRQVSHHFTVSYAVQNTNLKLAEFFPEALQTDAEV